MTTLAIYSASVALLCSLGCRDMRVYESETSPEPDKPSAPSMMRGASDSSRGSTGAGAKPSDEAGPAAIKRAHDDRTFMVDESTLMFDALDGVDVETDRYWGVLDGAGYRIEVPKGDDWNGMLVMYAHGYAGTAPMLAFGPGGPSIRKYWIENGYAWASSTYSTNYYDVRAGVEDTNKLALAFTKIAKDKGRSLEEPKKRYLTGHSMGGHVTGAAIEKEAQDTAENKVHYDAAMPMCGVLGDTDLFNYFAAYQFAAQKLADTKASTTPAEFAQVRMQTQNALFKTYPNELTPAGEKLKAIVRNLTGGTRSNFDEGFGTQRWQDAVWGTFGGDGTIAGILDRAVTDTREIVYQLDDDPGLSDEEKAFNDEVYRTEPAPGANGLRDDGLRWIPKVNGEFDIPVLAIHTLGDLYVPFMMEQIYHERAQQNGNGDRLVQRAMRGTGHCEFTYNEQAAAFEALMEWEQNGVKPAGDDVMDHAAMKQPTYGCKFTNNDLTAAEMSGGLAGVRSAVPACP